MALFTERIAVDLGTANTVIMSGKEVILEEPSVVAVDARTGEPIAIGRMAALMEEKTHEGIRVIRPMRDGVIADFTAAQVMIHDFLKKIPRSGWRRWLPVSWVLVISIPSSVTEVEKRAVRESAEQAGARQVHLVYQPIAAAVGLNLDIRQPVGYMIVDIGGGTTDITVISNEGIVVDQSIRIAGDEMTQNIVDYIRQEYQLTIGRRQAETLKKKVGSALESLPEKLTPEPEPVIGRDVQRGIPREIRVTHRDVAVAIRPTLESIKSAILKALTLTPASLTEDIYHNGIYLTGGGSQIRGLDIWISQITGLKVNRAPKPLHTVALGTSIIAQFPQEYAFALF